MTGDIDVRAVLAAADQTADIAEQGWAAYLGAPGTERYAGLATAVLAARGIPHLLWKLRPAFPGWDAWWEEQADLHEDATSAWVLQVRNVLDRSGTPSPPDETHLDPLFSRELMRRAPRGTVSWFLNDDLARSGWKVRLADDSLATVYFTVPAALARSFAALTVAPDGRTLERVFPDHLVSLRTLIESAYEHFVDRSASGTSAR